MPGTLLVPFQGCSVPSRRHAPRAPTAPTILRRAPGTAALATRVASELCGPGCEQIADRLRALLWDTRSRTRDRVSARSVPPVRAPVLASFEFGSFWPA